MKKENHPVNLSEVPSSPYELGVHIARFRFDAILAVFRGMKSEFERQSNEDEKMSYFTLVGMSKFLIGSIDVGINKLQYMLRISRTHMRHEFEEVPEITSSNDQKVLERKLGDVFLTRKGLGGDR